MINRDPVLETFLEETTERLDSLESGLLKLETSKECDPVMVNSIFRDAHSVKAGANLLKLKNLETLAHTLEGVLEQIRQCKLEASELVITASLAAVDKLRELVDNVEESESISVLLQTAMLDMATKKTLEKQGQ